MGGGDNGGGGPSGGVTLEGPFPTPPLTVGTPQCPTDCWVPALWRMVSLPAQNLWGTLHLEDPALCLVSAP